MNRASRHKPPPILLVEDNPGDIRLTVEALRGQPAGERLVVVTDGEAALACVRCEGRFAHTDRPGLVLLDLNIPRLDGRQVLAEIKNDPNLRRIPVIILTSSESSDDLHKVYGLHANCMVTKPADLDEYIRVVRTVVNFWFEVVELPPA